MGTPKAVSGEFSQSRRLESQTAFSSGTAVGRMQHLGSEEVDTEGRGGRGDRLLPENVVSSLTHKEQVLQVKIPKGFVLFC